MPLRGDCRSLRFVMMFPNRLGLLQSSALTSRSVPRKASSCHPRLRLAIQGFVLYQGFALPSRSVPRKAPSCHQGPAKYTSGQSPAHQSQPFYDRSPRIIRHVMIMALMLAIAMMMAVMQRCTSIVRACGSQLATPSTKLKRQQHLLARHWLAACKALACCTVFFVHLIVLCFLFLHFILFFCSLP